MRCDEVRELLSLLDDPELPAAEREPILAHLAGCAACTGELAGLRAALARVQELPPVEPPAGWRRALQQRLAQEERSPGIATRLRVWLNRPLAVPAGAAALAVMLVAGMSTAWFLRDGSVDRAGLFDARRAATVPALVEREGQAWQERGRIAETKAGAAIEDAASAAMPAPAPAGESASIRSMDAAAGRPPDVAAGQPPDAAARDLRRAGAAVQRQLVYTGSVHLEVADLDGARREVTGLAQGLGGWVEWESVSAAGPQNTRQPKARRAVLTLRLPSAHFAGFLETVADMGKVLAREMSSSDVTEEYVDLGARLRNWESQESRLIQILARAQTVADTLAVEAELGRVRQEIERLRGRLSYLERRVEFSSLTVMLSEPGAEPVASIWTEWGVIDALRQAGRAFMAVINGAIVLAGAAMPLAALGALAWLVYRLYRRARAA